MSGLRICCEDMMEKIMECHIVADYQNETVMMHGQRIHRCPKCGKTFEWVEE